MSAKKEKGLEGVSITSSSISHVGIKGKGVTFRGYSIEDLSSNSTFEEVAYLILKGNLPTEEQYRNFRSKLWSMRKLPQLLITTLEIIPRHARPIDVVVTISNIIGLIEPEKADMSNQLECAIRLIGMFFPALMYWHHFSRSGIRIKTETNPDDSVAENFLKLLKLKNEISSIEIKAIDSCFILASEHGLSASTFAARITASTLTDFHSAITSSLSVIKGRIHGAASRYIFNFFKDIKTKEEAVEKVKEKLQKKEVIMGFGHRIYKDGDPRHKILKKISKTLCERKIENMKIFEFRDHVEKFMMEEKGIIANGELFLSVCFQLCGIPPSIFPCLVAIPRTVGLSAHIFEQRANNRLISVRSKYGGPKERRYVDFLKRPRL